MTATAPRAAICRGRTWKEDYFFFDLVYCSDDNGRTWTTGGQKLSVPGCAFGADEPALIELRDGRVISVPLVWYPRLLDATFAQRKNWKIAGGGYGIHWPDVDEDLSTDGLLRGAPAANPRRS